MATGEHSQNNSARHQPRPGTIVTRHQRMTVKLRHGDDTERSKTEAHVPPLGQSGGGISCKTGQLQVNTSIHSKHFHLATPPDSYMNAISTSL